MPNFRAAFAIAALPILAIVGLIGAEALHGEQSRHEIVVFDASDLPPPGFGPANQSEAIDAVERRLTYGQEIVARDADAWLPREVLARARMRSFSTTGDFAALVQAEAELSQARRLAKPGTGPSLSSAEWAMSAHDLESARVYLEEFDRKAVKLSAAEKSTAVLLRSDLAFYSGSIAEASRLIDAAAMLEDGPAVRFRRAVIHKAKGEFDQAINALVDAARMDRFRTPQSLANISLQAGAIEYSRGRYESGNRWYRKAQSLFPGYWKTDLYIGEAALVSGDINEAIAQFEKVAQVQASPEAMDALAMLYRRKGDRASSAHWAEEAKQAWTERLMQLPTASIAHAAEHELSFGDPEKALELTSSNLEARPNGEARILLARALFASGKLASARNELVHARRSGWRSAVMFALLARVHSALGESELASNARQEALRLNPRIESREATLIWFAHG